MQNPLFQFYTSLLIYLSLGFLRGFHEHVVMISGLNTQDILEENEELGEQIKQYKRKITMTKDLILNLDQSYENSKRYIAIQRYRLMKSMIKTVVTNKWIKD